MKLKRQPGETVSPISLQDEGEIGFKDSLRPFETLKQFFSRCRAESERFLSVYKRLLALNDPIAIRYVFARKFKPMLPGGHAPAVRPRLRAVQLFRM